MPRRHFRASVVICWSFAGTWWVIGHRSMDVDRPGMWKACASNPYHIIVIVMAAAVVPLLSNLPCLCLIVVVAVVLFDVTIVVGGASYCLQDALKFETTKSVQALTHMMSLIVAEHEKSTELNLNFHVLQLHFQQLLTCLLGFHLPGMHGMWPLAPHAFEFHLQSNLPSNVTDKIVEWRWLVSTKSFRLPALFKYIDSHNPAVILFHCRLCSWCSPTLPASSAVDILDTLCTTPLNRSLCG